MAVEALRVGDLVLARGEHDPAGPVEAKLVEATFERAAPLLRLVVSGRVIRTTKEHPLYVEGCGWRAAQDVRPGDRLASHDGLAGVVQGVEDEGPALRRVAECHRTPVGVLRAERPPVVVVRMSFLLQQTCSRYRGWGLSGPSRSHRAAPTTGTIGIGGTVCFSGRAPAVWGVAPAGPPIPGRAVGENPFTTGVARRPPTGHHNPPGRRLIPADKAGAGRGFVTPRPPAPARRLG